MKTSATLLVASIAAALAPQAFAQSNVRLYGFMDTSVASLKGGNQSVNAVRSGDLIATRFGFSGAEDLGGGLKATFQLEAGYNGDTGAGATAGALSFNRHSLLGLQGNWGEVRVGRTFNSTMRQWMHYDPFFGGGLAASEAAVSSLAVYKNPQTGLRHNNQIEYWLPQNSPITGNFMYALRENTGEGYGGGRLAYKSGPLDVGVGYAKYKQPVAKDIMEASLGGKYNLGPAVVQAMLSRSANGMGLKQQGWLIGGSMRMKEMEYALSFSASNTKNANDVSTGTSRKVAAMARYHFSKRTSVYGLVAMVDNSNGAASAPLGSLTAAQVGANRTASAVSFGLVHSF